MNLSNLLDDINSGKISTKEAVNYLCSFLYKNYLLYGQDLRDEDFREEIILSVLENGEKIISKYDKTRSDFFGYFYCYVKSLIQTKKRTVAKKIMIESIAVSESINQYDKNQYKYDNIDYRCFDVPEIPYSSKPITKEDLQSIFKNVKGDKTLLILSIKAIYFVTDPMIIFLCNYYDISQTDFFKIVQYCKDLLDSKAARKEHLVERRNYAYYHHRQYEKRLVLLNENDDCVEKVLLKDKIERKNSKQINNFEKLNEKITKGTILVRPTNKVIASLLGICERQVEYYLICAKKKINDYIKMINDELEDENK